MSALTIPLDVRLMEAARDFLAATPEFSEMELRLRDEDGASENPKAIRMHIVATDNGRTVPRAPIRNLSLRIHFRANAKVDGAKAADLHAASNALEDLLGRTNLQSALSSEPRGLAVMLAVIRDGQEQGKDETVRVHSQAIDIRAVRLEQTIRRTVDTTFATAGDTARTADTA